MTQRSPICVILRLIALLMLLASQIYLAYSIHEQRALRREMMKEWRVK